jgi:hypothetical protein
LDSDDPGSFFDAIVRADIGCVVVANMAVGSTRKAGANRGDIVISGLRFVLRPESFCIHRLPPDRQVDLDRFKAVSWYSITRTDDELSVIAPDDIDLGPGERKAGWSCLQIGGTLDFALVGVIAGISSILAEANVSIFTVSTFNTDCILIRTSDVETAVRALTAAGHFVAAG